MHNPALLRDEDFRADQLAPVVYDEVRCVCGAVVFKDDAVRADDGKSWLCFKCALAIRGYEDGRI